MQLYSRDTLQDSRKGSASLEMPSLLIYLVLPFLSTRYQASITDCFLHYSTTSWIESCMEAFWVFRVALSRRTKSDRLTFIVTLISFELVLAFGCLYSLCMNSLAQEEQHAFNNVACRPPKLSVPLQQELQIIHRDWR